MCVHDLCIDTMPETISDKAALRRELLADRQAITPEVRRQWNIAICAHLGAWWERHQMRTLGVYWPIRGEVDLRTAYDALRERGVRLALPVVVDKNSPLQFIEWQAGVTMTKDNYGVMVPTNGVITRPEALLIPCVGFNAQRFRLGYGGGFYDRTLAVSPRPLAVGISYACALAAFEADTHDVALDAIITENSAL